MSDDTTDQLDDDPNETMLNEIILSSNARTASGTRAASLAKKDSAMPGGQRSLPAPETRKRAGGCGGCCMLLRAQSTRAGRADGLSLYGCTSKQLEGG